MRSERMNAGCGRARRNQACWGVPPTIPQFWEMVKFKQLHRPRRSLYACRRQSNAPKGPCWERALRIRTSVSWADDCVPDACLRVDCIAAVGSLWRLPGHHGGLRRCDDRPVEHSIAAWRFGGRGGLRIYRGALRRLQRALCPHGCAAIPGLSAVAQGGCIAGPAYRTPPGSYPGYRMMALPVEAIERTRPDKL